MADEDDLPPRPDSPPEFHVAWRGAGMTEQGEDGNPTRKVSKPAVVAMQQARSIRHLLDHVDRNLTEARHPVLSNVQRDALTGLLSHNMNARVGRLATVAGQRLLPILVGTANTANFMPQPIVEVRSPLPHFQQKVGCCDSAKPDPASICCAGHTTDPTVRRRLTSDDEDVDI